MKIPFFIKPLSKHFWFDWLDQVGLRLLKSALIQDLLIVPFIFQIEKVFPVPLWRYNSEFCVEITSFLDGLLDFQVFSGELFSDRSGAKSLLWQLRPAFHGILHFKLLWLSFVYNRFSSNSLCMGSGAFDSSDCSVYYEIVERRFLYGFKIFLQLFDFLLRRHQRADVWEIPFKQFVVVLYLFSFLRSQEVFHIMNLLFWNISPLQTFF